MFQSPGQTGELEVYHRYLGEGQRDSREWGGGGVVCLTVNAN